MLLRRGSEGVRAYGAGARVPDAPGHLFPVEDAAVETAGVRACLRWAAVERGSGPREARRACRDHREGGEGFIWEGACVDDEQGEGAD